jgi:hypothetical protein
MTETQKAYIAGIIDGEGCIYINYVPVDTVKRPRQVNPNFSLFVRVSMCNERLIRHIHRTIGTGSVSHSGKFKEKHPEIKMNKPWLWAAAQHRAAQVLKDILPYLVLKKHEAELGIAFESLPLPPRGGNGGSRVIPKTLALRRYRFYATLRRLKPRFKFDKHRMPLKPFTWNSH